MGNGEKRPNVKFKDAAKEGLLLAVHLGWLDAAEGKPFPREYETWDQSDQQNYEVARQAYVEANAHRKRPVKERTVFTQAHKYAPATLALRQFSKAREAAL